MKKYRRWIAGFLCALLIIAQPYRTGSVAYASAAGQETVRGSCGEGVTWTFDRASSTLTISGTGKMEDFTFEPPWKVYSYDIRTIVIEDGITTVGRAAFQGCLLAEKLSVGDRVTRIEDRAFESCWHLEDVTLPSGLLYIGAAAFRGCNSLKTITIPNTVQTIDNSAFGSCVHLTHVTLQEGLTRIGNYAFQSCYSLAQIAVPATVERIGECAFFGCYAAGAITISDGVRSIGELAFATCIAVEQITIPKSVTEIGAGAFLGCTKLKQICVDAENTAFCDAAGILFSKDGTRLMQYPCAKVDTHYTVPQGVTAIDEEAFRSCAALTEVSLPHSVQTIGDGAFHDCKGLTQIAIPDAVTDMGKYTFDGCSSLTTVRIGKGLASVDGAQHFTGCVCLKEIFVDADNSHYCSVDGVWFSKDKTQLIRYPIAAEETFYFVPSGVEVIGNGAFSHCEDLAGIAIPKSVQCIGEDAMDKTCGIEEIYYFGTEIGWENVQIDRTNTAIAAATVYCLGGRDNCTHTYTQTQTRPATCARAGINTYTCTLCGTRSIEIIAALPHTPTKCFGTEATCTTAGLTDGESCAVCGKVLISQQTIPATGHTPSAWITDKVPAVGVAGAQHIECTVCGATLQTQTIPALPESQEPLLAVSSGTAYIGKRVQVHIRVRNNPGLVGIRLFVDYDPSVLTLQSVAGGSIFPQEMMMAGRDTTAVPYCVLFEDSLSTENHTDDGELVTFTFVVRLDASEGTTAITVRYDAGSTFDSDLQCVSFGTRDGVWNICRLVPGDADKDGTVTLRDAVVIERHLVGGYAVKLHEDASDVNEDGAVDLVDAVLIKRCLAGGFGVQLR